MIERDRKSGILMPIPALPSPYGVGTLGREAFRFVDFLKNAGQRCWQLLPLGPAAAGDSPYTSFSSWAGNPYFIDLELLCEDGLLEEGDLASIDWGDDLRRVDYEKLRARRPAVLRRAFEVGRTRNREAVRAFEEENRRWLPDYALFMALRTHFGREWTRWPDEGLRLREPERLVHYGRLLGEDVEFHAYVQYLFFRQWRALRDYARSAGVELIGDLPVYAALDSADVWAEPEFFQLDENRLPLAVAGVPPDRFSAEGQLWGNPLYDWERMREDGYGWWLRRLDGARRLCDTVRIDHFRGFESYWSVPRDAASAGEGRWVKGPGMGFIGVLKNWFPDTPIIAEDLGAITPAVRKLLADSGFPGMRVLAFAFDAGEPESDHRPHTYERRCVCYVGTHDNETVRQWEETAAPANAAFARRYLGIGREEDLHWGLIRGGMASVADRFVVQMQDCLGLGAEGRMNVPGTAAGNWRWRLLPGEADAALAERLHTYAKMYGRCE